MFGNSNSADRKVRGSNPFGCTISSVASFKLIISEKLFRFYFHRASLLYYSVMQNSKVKYFRHKLPISSRISGVTKRYLNAASSDIAAGALDPDAEFQLSLVESQIGHAISGHVLELGCGSGSLSSSLAKREMKALILTDASKQQLAICRSNLALGKSHNISFKRLNASRPRLNDSVFDVICGRAVLHHLMNPTHAISEYAPALKHNGFMFFSEPFLQSHLIWLKALLEIQETVTIENQIASKHLTQTIDAIRVMADLYEPKISKRNLDDKSFVNVEEISREFRDFQVQVVGVPRAHLSGLLERHTKFTLAAYFGLQDMEDVPTSYWKILRSYDEELIKIGIPLEGTLLMKKLDV